MRRIAAPVVLLAALGACEQEQALSGDDVLREARSLDMPKPGLYASSTELVEFTVPGLPPAQADRMRAQMSGLSSDAQPYCLTQEEAAKGYEDMLRAIGEQANEMSCAFSRFDTDAPRFSAKLGCSGPAGINAALEMAGTTSSEGFDMTMDMDVSNQMIPGGSMKMRMKVGSKWVGECPAEGTGEGFETAP